MEWRGVYMQKTLDPRLLMSRMTEGGEGEDDRGGEGEDDRGGRRRRGKAALDAATTTEGG